MLRLICLLMLSLSMGACGAISDMKKNAKSASKNSDRAADAAEASREEIANSRLLSRSASASKSRRDALAALIAAQSFELKVTEAAKFLKAFEYQLVTWQRYDTPEYYQELLTEGFNEFFRSLKEVNNDTLISSDVPSPISVSSDNRQTALSVYAIAAALHESHIYSKASTAGKSPGNNPQSILNLIFKTLKKINSFEDGNIEYSSFKSYEKVIYQNKDEALALLNYRLDMLLLIVLRKSTTSLNQSVGNKIRIAKGKISKKLSKLPTLFTSLNYAQKAYILAVFKRINEVTSFQEANGIDINIHSDVILHLKSISYKSIVEVQNKSSDTTQKDIVANEEFVQQMDNILSFSN